MKEAEPHLLVDEGWFGSARELCRTDPVFAAMGEELQRRCDELLDPSAARHLDPDDLDSRWWQSRNGNKQLICAVADLAFAARCFDDQRYADLARHVFDNLVEHNMTENCGRKGGMTPTGGPQGWFSRLDSAHAAELLGLALDWLRPAVGDDHGRTIARYLARFTHWLVENNTPLRDQDPPDLINAAAIGKVGEGEGALALSRWGLMDPESHIEHARRAASQYLDEGGHDEGILNEGPMYGFGVLKHIAVLAGMLADRGDHSLWESDAWDEVVRAYCSQMLPDGRLNMLNDAYDQQTHSWLLAAARYRRNGLARWLWGQIVRPCSDRRWDPVMPWDYRPGWWNGFVPHAMLSYDPDVAPVSPDQAGLSPRRFFEFRGILDVRDGWGEDDSFVSVTCRPDIRWRSRVHHQHAQADRGHFSLSALGEDFLVDVGYGHEVFEDTPAVQSPGGTGEGHSVPQIDGRAQVIPTLATGFTDVVTGAWASLGRMEYGSTYPAADMAYRTVAAVPDQTGRLMYLVVHDFVSVPCRIATMELLFQAGWDTHVESVERQQVDIVGPRHGNRCRLIATANMPGLFKWEGVRLYPYLFHPRLRYRWRDSSINALTIVVPYRRDEAPPVFERTDVNDSRGFAARLSFRGLTDTMVLNVVNRFAGMGCETDAQFALIRDGADPRLIVVDGSRVCRDDKELWNSPKRTVYVGESD